MHSRFPFLSFQTFCLSHTSCRVLFSHWVPMFAPGVQTWLSSLKTAHPCLSALMFLPAWLPLCNPSPSGFPHPCSTMPLSPLCPLSPSWDLPAFPEPPPWGVNPCRSCRNPGHCLCHQIHGKNNKLLKKEVESSTYYLISRAAPMQVLGTTTGQWWFKLYCISRGVSIITQMTNLLLAIS